MTRSSLDLPGSRPLWPYEDPPRPPAGAGDCNDGDGGRPPSRRGGSNVVELTVTLGAQPEQTTPLG